MGEVNVAGFATLTFAALVLDRAFAFALAVLMSSAFGTSSPLDMYLLAVAGPTVLATLIGDLVYSLLLPKLTLRRCGGDGADARWAVMLSAALVVGAITLAYALAWVAAVSSLASVEDASAMLVLGALTSLLILFGGIGSLGATLLIAERNYVLAVARFPLGSFVTVVSFIALRPLTPSVDVLAQSVVIGSLVSAVVMVAGAARLLGPVSLAGIGDRGSYAGLGKTSIAQLTAGISAQGSVLIERIIGVGLGAGVVSSLNYGRTLASPPLLLGQSIATASYPRFVHGARASRRHQDLGRMIGVVVVLLLPLSVMLALLADPLVRLLFARGSFDETATLHAATAASIFAVALVPIGVSAVATRFLYAEQHSAKVASLSLLTLVAYSALAVVLGRSIGYQGLAAAGTASYVFMAVALILGVRGSAYRGWEHVPFSSSARSLAAALFMIGVIVFAGALRGGSTRTGDLLGTSAVVALGAGAYCLALLLLRSPELVQVAATARRVAGSLSRR